MLFNWAYVYFTRRRHAQLIVGAAPLTEGAEAPSRARPDPAEPAPEPLSSRARNGSLASSAR